MKNLLRAWYITIAYAQPFKLWEEVVIPLGSVFWDVKCLSVGSNHSVLPHYTHSPAFMMFSRRYKSQDTIIAIAWEALFLYCGHKRAPKLPGISVSSVDSLDRTWKTCQTLIRTWETWGTLSERNRPGGDVLAAVVDRGPKRSAPWASGTQQPLLPTARHGYRDRPWENLARLNKTWIRRKKWPISHGALRFGQTGLPWPPGT